MPFLVQPLPSFVRRVLSRLRDAEALETDPWLRDDLRIARLTVVHAARGDARLCSPDVLASYTVLGLHPEKVWPAIEARRIALGPLEAIGAPPKKPAQSVKLWCDKTNGARAANSHAAMQQGSPRTTTSVPMATPSIAALYPNSDALPSAKKRSYTLDEIKRIVAHSGAPPTVVAVTLAALSARGEWPREDGPATTTLCVALKGLMLDSVPSCCRRTAQRRIKRALKDQYWRSARAAHSWTDCPQCGQQRKTAKCEKCKYRGRSKDATGKWTGEFMIVPTYEFDIERFRHAPRCKEIRHLKARTYAEFKEHGNLAEMPRKPARPAPDPPPPPAAPIRQPAAEHAHRNPLRATSVVGGTAVSDRATKAAKLLMEMCGLADLGAVPQIAISINAEAKFRGMEIEDAAKLIAECAASDQKKGVALTRFYFRDLKWRTSDGRQTSASAERSERSKRNILDGLLANARGPDAPDGPEREE